MGRSGTVRPGPPSLVDVLRLIPSTALYVGLEFYSLRVLSAKITNMLGYFSPIIKDLRVLTLVRDRAVCKECKGAGLCKHGSQKRWCKSCGKLCPHGKQRNRCARQGLILFSSARERYIPGRWSSRDVGSQVDIGHVQKSRLCKMHDANNKNNYANKHLLAYFRGRNCVVLGFRCSKGFPVICCMWNEPLILPCSCFESAIGAPCAGQGCGGTSVCTHGRRRDTLPPLSPSLESSLCVNLVLYW